MTIHTIGTHDMNTTTRTLTTIACLFLASIARADEPPAVELEPASEPGPWRISVGARFAPGVKTSSAVSSSAVVDAAGRLHGSNASRGGGAVRAPGGPSSSVERSSETAVNESTETVAVTPTSRFEFEYGFVDMADSGTGDGKTWYWHFDSADAFDDASGSLTGTKTTVTRTSESSAARSVEGGGSASAVRSSFSERVLPDVSASCESDLWGFDVEIGRDLWRGESLSLSLDLGATLYRGEDAVRAAGRCYEAVAETRRESVAGRYATTRETTVETMATATETMVFVDSDLAGQLADFRNDDGSIGAGTADGYSNPYGGPNPTLTVSDGSVTRTTRTEVRTDTTVSTTRVLESAGSRVSGKGGTVVRRTIDVAAEGDVEMQELRLALRPAWRAAEWLELRGALGAVATRVDVDVDATILVNGARFSSVSGSDDGWVLSGLCGLEAAFAPCDWIEIVVGGDVRFGDTEMDYRAGLVRGTVELARYTVRAGVGIRF